MSIYLSVDHFRNWVVGKTAKLSVYNEKFMNAMLTVLCKTEYGISFVFVSSSNGKQNIIDYNLNNEFNIEVYYDRLSNGRRRVAKTLFDMVHVFYYVQHNFNFDLIDKIRLLNEEMLIALLEKIFNVELPC
jgi:hypothetical protein